LKRYERPRERIDDTVLAEANLMVKYNPGRYMAWWEMAQIYAKRKQYKHALFALNQHLARSPNRNLAAEKLHRQLTQRMNASGKK
jgi:cytochrome c-type biogenesis protein CcmH/NrfG